MKGHNMNLKKTIIKTLATTSLLLLLTQTANAVSAANGKDLHDAICIACHISLTNGQPASLYTRSDRKFNTLKGLNEQVMRCQNSVGANWFDDQIADVVEYLNTNYYKVK